MMLLAMLLSCWEVHAGSCLGEQGTCQCKLVGKGMVG